MGQAIQNCCHQDNIVPVTAAPVVLWTNLEVVQKSRTRPHPRNPSTHTPTPRGLFLVRILEEDQYRFVIHSEGS